MFCPGMITAGLGCPEIVAAEVADNLMMPMMKIKMKMMRSSEQRALKHVIRSARRHDGD